MNVRAYPGPSWWRSECGALVLATGLGVLTGGCGGKVSLGSNGLRIAGSDGGAGLDAGVKVAGGSDTGAGIEPARRLTILEYNNTVRDLLGDFSAPASVTNIGVDLGVESISFRVGAPIADGNVAALFAVATATAARAAGRLAQLLPPVAACGAAATPSDPTGCA